MSVSEESEHCGSGFDRTINRLPKDVIDKILTSLPIVEAAKTAVLSKYWNRGWRNISELKFDFFFGKKFKKAGHLNLTLAICRILFLHSGSIDGFTLSIPWLESCAEINLIIQFLSDKKVKHLNIHFISGDRHVLPSYLFSCFRLRTLQLARCVLNLPRNFGGFSELITLDLFRVDVTNDFDIFISNCPLLQQVTLRLCRFKEVSSINITAPNLRTFCCLGYNLFVFFVSAPLLNQLTLDVCNLSGESPKCLLQLKDLIVYNVVFADIKGGSSLAGLIKSSPNIERLTILVSPLVGLIRSSPNIERLEISVNDYTEEINHDEEYGFSSNRRLQIVELYNLCGTNAEMMFVKALLLKSPQLKEMTIYIVDEKKELQILREMIGFRRASVDVVIKLILKKRLIFMNHSW